MKLELAFGSVAHAIFRGHSEGVAQLCNNGTFYQRQLLKGRTNSSDLVKDDKVPSEEMRKEKSVLACGLTRLKKGVRGV